MSFMNQLLSDSEIRALCLSAFRDANALVPALEAIYRKGFANTPQMDNAEKTFVQRLVMVRNEYAAQLAAFLSDSETWTRNQLELADDENTMTCCIGVLAALEHANRWEKIQCIKLLDQKMEAKQVSTEQNLRLVQLFSQTPMASIFTGGQMPIISQQAIPQFAGILAMCSYVCVKQSPREEIVPDLSFDAICIWSNAMTDALCTRNKVASNAAAIVGCVMAAQYMHIFQWDVLKCCMQSMYSLSYPTMENVINLICTEILDHTESPEQLYQIDWIWPEKPDFDFTVWLLLLREQQNTITLRNSAFETEEYQHSRNKESAHNDE